MQDLVGDVRYAFRTLVKSPAVSLAAVAALALGIGANTAIFSVVNTVLLRPMAYPGAERLVLFGTDQGNNGGSPAKFMHWRAQTDVVEDVSAFRHGVVNYTGGGDPEQIREVTVTPDFFRLFGSGTAVGRTFSRDEGLPNGARVVVLSHDFWTRRFGGDAGVLGKSVLLSGDPHVVVGVLPEAFHFNEFADDPEVYLPFPMDPNTSDQGHYFRVAGRLKEGVSFEQSVAKLKLSTAAYKEKYPTALAPEENFRPLLLRESIIGDARSSLLVLAGAVSFVLLIACSNVANLLLVKAAGRGREMAIRAAIGAGRGRIIRQLLTESVMLSLAGGAVGLLAGSWGIRALLSINTANIPRLGEDGAFVSLDWRVLLFTIAVSAGTGILFGLAPAWHAVRSDLSEALKESGRGSGFGQNRTRSILVAFEMSLALILLIGAALLIRTSTALSAVEPGYDTQNVLTMRMSLTGPRFLKTEGVEQLVRDGRERLLAIPGVVAASAACCVPLEGGYGLPFIIQGRPLEGAQHGGGGWGTVSPGYFEVFRIPVKRGRAFDERDTAASEPVVIINEAMANQFWKDGDPLLDRLMIGKGVMQELAEERPRRIVGVVGNVRDGGLTRDPFPTMYVPNAQIPDALNALNVRLSQLAWMVRTQGDPYAVRVPMERELRQLSGLPVANIRSMGDVVSRSTSRQRFNMWAMTGFGIVATLLAAIGIYGLMGYTVEQRTREIGIRLALGAEPSNVRNLIVKQGARLVLVGVVVGIACAFGLARFLESFLFGVQSWDPMVFALAPVVLGVVGVVTTWIPARRATKVDPLAALRYE